MNAVTRILAGVGAGTVFVIGLVVVDVYEVAAVELEPGNTALVYNYLTIAVFAALAVIVLATVTRLR